jgi:hypothetical protein
MFVWQLATVLAFLIFHNFWICVLPLPNWDFSCILMCTWVVPLFAFNEMNLHAIFLKYIYIYIIILKQNVYFRGLA